tara:strand:+ start:631 stop:963 length:333 start_codon:yes stop_codon:yes gene_type:complete
MEKFLKILVTNTDETSGYRYVSLNDILQVIQASTTTVTVTYRNAVAASDVLTITHGAIASNAHTMRDWFTDSMEGAYAQSWQKSAINSNSPLPLNAAGTAPVTVTAIALA